MTATTRALRPRRLASLSLVAVLGLAIAGPSTVGAASEPAVDQAVISASESAMVAALNANRTARGLVKVQVDSRLMAIARARSADMVAKDYFSHTQPDGRNVFSILSGSGITWYGAGEILAWNNYPMDSTVAAADNQWMNSAGHKAIVISTDYNYVGVGLAVEASSGKKLWTAVYMKGPDRTGARATTGSASLRAGATAEARRARVTWTGYDPRLQVLTAGMGTYTVQKKVDDGAFRTVWSSTTLTYTNFNLLLGHRYEFRIAARDKRGNQGAWATKVIDLR